MPSIVCFFSTSSSGFGIQLSLKQQVHNVITVWFIGMTALLFSVLLLSLSSTWSKKVHYYCVMLHSHSQLSCWQQPWHCLLILYHEQQHLLLHHLLLLTSLASSVQKYSSVYMYICIHLYACTFSQAVPSTCLCNIITRYNYVFQLSYSLLLKTHFSVLHNQYQQ